MPSTKYRLAAEDRLPPQQCKYVDDAGVRHDALTKVRRRTGQGWARNEFCRRHAWCAMTPEARHLRGLHIGQSRKANRRARIKAKMRGILIAVNPLGTRARHATSRAARRSPNPAGRRIQDVMKARGIEYVIDVARQAGLSINCVLLLVTRKDRPIRRATAEKLSAWDGDWSADQYLAAAGDAAARHVIDMRAGPVLEAMKRHLEVEPDHEVAREVADRIERAVLKKSRRGITTALELYDRDPLSDRYGWAPGRGHKKQWSTEARVNQAVSRIYRHFARGHSLPCYAELVADAPKRRPGRKVERRLPPAFRNPPGFITFCAAVLQLDAHHLSHAEIATWSGFGPWSGFTVDKRHSRMITVLLDTTERIAQLASRQNALLAEPWCRASTEAAELLSANGLLPVPNRAQTGNELAPPACINWRL